LLLRKFIAIEFVHFLRRRQRVSWRPVWRVQRTLRNVCIDFPAVTPGRSSGIRIKLL